MNKQTRIFLDWVRIPCESYWALTCRNPEEIFEALKDSIPKFRRGFPFRLVCYILKMRF